MGDITLCWLFLITVSANIFPGGGKYIQKVACPALGCLPTILSSRFSGSIVLIRVKIVKLWGMKSPRKLVTPWKRWWKIWGRVSNPPPLRTLRAPLQLKKQHMFKLEPYSCLQRAWCTFTRGSDGGVRREGGKFPGSLSLAMTPHWRFNFSPLVLICSLKRDSLRFCDFFYVLSFIVLSFSIVIFRCVVLLYFIVHFMHEYCSACVCITPMATIRVSCYLVYYWMIMFYSLAINYLLTYLILCNYVRYVSGKDLELTEPQLGAWSNRMYLATPKRTWDISIERISTVCPA